MRLVFSASLGYQMDMNNESIDNIASRLAEAVPQGLKSVREDLEQNFRGVLRASLSKLDLVTREEFEVQEAVLAKTRAKLEALEAKVRELEVGAKAPPAS
jgi:BMFP domain-containing protein YqiC